MRIAKVVEWFQIWITLLLLCYISMCSEAIKVAADVHSKSPHWLHNNPSFAQTGVLREAVDSSTFEMLEHSSAGDKFRGWDDEGFDAANLFFWMQMDGIVLELGGLDGKAFSVSRDFIPFNWHRIIVEATPKWHHTASKVSPDATYITAAICQSSSDVHFLLRPKTDNAINGIAEFMSKSFMEEMHPHVYKEAMKTGTFDVSQVNWNHFHDHSYNRTNEKHSESAEISTTFVHQMSCLRLDDVLVEINVKHINLFILDVGGAELSVLQSIDFTKVLFDVICVDDIGFRDVGYSEDIKKLLSNRGYVYMFDKGRNSWYKHADYSPHSRTVNQDKVPVAESIVSQTDMGSVTIVPTVPTKGLSAGHFSNHLGALRDQDYIFNLLGIEATNFLLLEYEITSQFANDYFQKNRDMINSFDIVVTSDTTPLSRIFLQNLIHLKPRVVIWICNRLDYDVHDEQYLSLIKDALKRDDSKVLFIPYTEYEKQDAWQRFGINLANLPVITPHGLQLEDDDMMVEAGKHYKVPKAFTNTVPEQQTSNANIQASTHKGIFIPRYQNDQTHIQVPRIFRQHNILHVSGSYSHPSQLKEYSALVTFPDAMSKFLTFETIQYGIPTILPSIEWMEKLVKQKYFFNGDNLGNQPKRKFWYENEWYRFPECRIYVNNEEELVHVAKQLNEGTYPDMDFLLFKMQERAKIISETTLKKWSLIYSITASSPNGAVLKKVFEMDQTPTETCLLSYKEFLRVGTLAGLYKAGPHIKSHTVSYTKKIPSEPEPGDRYESFLAVFKLMIKSNAQPKVIVDMGVTRSFRDWQMTQNANEYFPRNASSWDWRGGSFTRLAAECNQHIDGLQLMLVDSSKSAIFVARTVTRNFSFVSTHTTSSAEFLKSYDGPPITLFYSDLGDPVGGFHLHLEEAEILTRRRNILLARDAYVLIDNVRNMGPFQKKSIKEYGEPTHAYGNSRDSIPYFLEHGWIVLFSGYQWILKAPPMS